MNAYVVIGETGEYSDQQRWLVCAFTSRKSAEKYARLAQKAANDFKRNDEDVDRKYELPFKEANPYDPDMMMYYTGTKYHVEEAPLRNSVKEIRA